MKKAIHIIIGISGLQHYGNLVVFFGRPDDLRQLFHHHLILYILNNFAEHIQTDTLRKFPTAWGMKPHIRGIRSPRCGGKLRLE